MFDIPRIVHLGFQIVCLKRRPFAGSPVRRRLAYPACPGSPFDQVPCKILARGPQVICFPCKSMVGTNVHSVRWDLHSRFGSSPTTRKASTLPVQRVAAEMGGWTYLGATHFSRFEIERTKKTTLAPFRGPVRFPTQRYDLGCRWDSVWSSARRA